MFKDIKICYRKWRDIYVIKMLKQDLSALMDKFHTLNSSQLGTIREYELRREIKFVEARLAVIKGRTNE